MIDFILRHNLHATSYSKCLASMIALCVILLNKPVEVNTARAFVRYGL